MESVNAFVEFKELVAERVRWHAHAAIPWPILDSLDIRLQADALADHLVATLCAPVLQHKLPDQESSTVVEKLMVSPTWWDHLKLTLKTKWEWLPLHYRYEEHTVTTRHVLQHYRVCPHIQGKDPRVHFAWMADEKPLWPIDKPGGK